MRMWRRLQETAAAVLLAAIVALVALNVVLRYGFQSSLPWATGLVTVTFVWVIMLAAGAAFRDGLLLGIDYLPSLIKGAAGRWYRAGVLVITTLILIVFTALSLMFVIDTAERQIAVLELPYFWLTTALPFGGFVMASEAAVAAVREFMKPNIEVEIA